MNDPKEDKPTNISSDAYRLAFRRIGWLLLTIFVIRIPLVFFAELLKWSENVVVAQLLEFSMYALTAAMIAAALTSFPQFRIDRFSLVLFVVLGMALIIPAGETSSLLLDVLSFAYVLIAPLVAILILRSRRTRGGWAPVDTNWPLLGLVSSLGLRVSLIALNSVVSGTEFSLQLVRPLTAGGLVVTVLAFIGSSVVVEELAFRGFLWGYLERHRWKGVRIWLVQAALFWIAHLRLRDQPFIFWVAVPAAGLLFGWLTWKSRSVAAGIVAHTTYNTFGFYI